MIQIEVLKERKGANSFGTCSACGKESSEDDRMIRLIFSRIIGNARHSTSVCLCFKCAGELMTSTKGWWSVMTENGCTNTWHENDFEKTGRRFDEIEIMLEKMRGEE